MTTDFNKKGREVTFVAHKADPPYFELLSADSRELAEEIETAITSYDEGTLENSFAMAAVGCFERFRGCILYISRLVEYEKEIRAKAPNSAMEVIFIRKVEALIEFESLLFHGRSALDRLAFFIAKKIYNQDCDKYNKLKNVLKCFENKDERASKLIDVIDSSSYLFEGVLFDAQEKKSLRSDMIHKSTASERASVQCALYCLGPQKRIAFDAIIGGYPMFNTCQEIGKGLAFVVLNSLSLCLGLDGILSFEKAGLTWESLMVDYREYLSDNPSDKRFTIWNIKPYGCSLSPVPIVPEIINKAY